MSDVISKMGDPERLAARLAGERPADVVEALNRNASRSAAKILLALPEPLAVEALDEPQLKRGAAIVSELPPGKAAHFIDGMSADRAAGIVRELRVSVRNDLLALVGPETKATLDRLLPYPENCAGGIMTTEFVAVPGDWTVGQTLEHIKAVELTRETVYSIYILDPQRRALVRAATLRRLITADPQATVKDAAPARKPLTVRAQAPLDETVRLISKYNLLAIPVVDDAERVIGIVTVDDAVDTLVAQQDAEVQQFGGVAPLEAPYMSVGFLAMIKKDQDRSQFAGLGHPSGTPARRHGWRCLAENVCGLPRPVARYGDEGGPSPLSTAYGAAADQPRVDQRRHRRAAVFLHRDVSSSPEANIRFGQPGVESRPKFLPERSLTKRVGQSCRRSA